MAKCKDHLGIEHKSKSAMCHAYNIHVNTFDNRIKEGMTLEEALTTPSQKPRKKKKKYEQQREKTQKCIDHNGHVHANISEACKQHGITYSAFYERLMKGLCPEDALVYATEHSITKIPVVDPFGNYFETIESMCDFWSIKKDVYLSRIRSEHNQCAALGLIPMISMQKQKSIFKDVEVFKFAYIGCDGQEYYFCNVNGKENILPRDILYRFMELRLKKEVSLYAVRECIKYD